MEDFALDIVIGKGPSARTVRLDLPRFTLIGATTRLALLSSPLRDRFGAVYRLDFYEPAELDPHHPPQRLGARGATCRRRRPTDRRTLPRHAAHRQPAAEAGPGLRPGPERRDRHRGHRRGGPEDAGDRPPGAGQDRPRASSSPSSTSSAAGRSACRPSPPPCPRRWRRSRRSTSRSSCSSA